jgi:NADH dehydrogenase/putative oxidoreductase
MAINVLRLQEERFSPFLRVTLRIWVKVYRSFTAAARPVADIVIRAFLAQAFLRSGFVHIADWNTALYLARYEYPVSWMAPDTAAILGATIELAGSFFLLLGLFTRPAATAMFALLLISQLSYLPTTTNLFMMSMLGWYVFHGAGSFSFDRALGAGFAQSAVPVARTVIGAGVALSRFAAPLWMLIVRIWLAAAIAGAIGWIDPPIWLATWLPQQSFAGMPALLGAILLTLLLPGIFMPLAALLLLTASGTAMVMAMVAGLHSDLTTYPILAFILLGLWGSRGASLDALVSNWLERNILFDRQYRDIPAHWPHIVVVGAGFGGLACVARLRNLPVRITLIDRHNYHLFQPLLYQIATAVLSPADISTPIRSLFRRDGNVRVIMGEVTAIDTATQSVEYEASNRLDYDKLVLATGATHSYFGRDEWSDFAPGLKTVDDGVSMRCHILRAFEKAESIGNPDRVQRLLTFVIVGAGPTGVELASAIAELAKHSVAREFRTIDPSSARIILLQSGDRILPAFPEKLSSKACTALEQLGVEVRTGSRVTKIASDHVRIGEDQVIDTETVFWAAGVKASPAGHWLNAETDRDGRVVVDECLRVPTHDNIFVIGDTARSLAWNGKPVPGLAPAAKQAGKYVARQIERDLRGDGPLEPFAYAHQGSLATIGRKNAVADFGWVKLSGASAWWLWGVVHVGFLSGTRNRVAVLVNWAWNYFTLQLGIRLITGKDKSA